MSLNETPRGERIHIGFFGRTNAGKSSIINAIANQEVSIVSDIKGTTTDAVFKSMEIVGIGACVLIDTAGFDDDSNLSEKRIEKTGNILERTDIGVVVFADDDISKELEWIEKLRAKKTPVIAIINKIDENKNTKLLQHKIEKINLRAISVSAKEKKNIQKIIEELRNIALDIKESSICGHLVKKDDVVLLVMPQDIQAPKGRLILPQVQTIRDLLDNKCIVISVTADNLEKAFKILKEPPKLIITDSQVFAKVYEQKPQESALTSFSVLFSRHKGDIDIFVEGAYSISNLKNGDKVLIAEACSHDPLDGDIGRIKLPALLRKKTRADLDIQVVSGNNFPIDLSEYSLIIHCGSCMFNKKYVMNRVEQARNQGIPITNYGIAIAYMNNILEKIKK